MDLKTLVERHDTPAGKAFDLCIQALIIISLISFSIETLPDISAETLYWLGVIETVTVSIFTVEYLLRLHVADRPLSYALSFFGIIDLLSILPYYLGLAVDFRFLRSMRILRLFRLFKLIRYNLAIERFYKAFIIAKEEFTVFAVTTIILLFFAGVGIYYFEHEAQPEAFASIFHSLWWALITLTTVGYGDMVPITVGGRFFTFIILLIGLGIVAIPAGLLAAALNQVRRDEDEQAKGNPDE